jgi:Na+(H+)/acetate symporter ActP
LGPSVWVSVLKNPAPIVPMDYPAIFSVPIAFVVMIVVSLSTREVSAGMTAPVRGNGFAKSAQESGIKAGRPGV